MNELIKNLFGHKTRIRVLGVAIFNQKVLLLNHKNMNIENTLWGFPGGGVDGFETLDEALKREFLEELNLEVESYEFINIKQFIKKPLHAVEVFFSVQIKDYQSIRLGFDPELKKTNQILSEFRWFNKEELLNLPKNFVQTNLIEIIELANGRHL